MRDQRSTLTRRLIDISSKRNLSKATMKKPRSEADASLAAFCSCQPTISLRLIRMRLRQSNHRHLKFRQTVDICDENILPRISNPDLPQVLATCQMQSKLLKTVSRLGYNAFPSSSNDVPQIVGTLSDLPLKRTYKILIDCLIRAKLREERKR